MFRKFDVAWSLTKGVLVLVWVAASFGIAGLILNVLTQGQIGPSLALSFVLVAVGCLILVQGALHLGRLEGRDRLTRRELVKRVVLFAGVSMCFTGGGLMFWAWSDVTRTVYDVRALFLLVPIILGNLLVSVFWEMEKRWPQTGTFPANARDTWHLRVHGITATVVLLGSLLVLGLFIGHALR